MSILEEEIARGEEELYAHLVLLSSWLRARFSRKEITRFLVQGNYSFYDREVELLAESLAGLVAEQRERTARRLAEQLSRRLGTLITAHPSPALYEEARQRLVREFQQDVAARIQQIAAHGMERGLFAEDLAGIVLRTTGLSPTQVQLQLSFQQALTTAGQHGTARPLAAQAERMLLQRSQALAEELAQVAAHEGQEQLYEQLISEDVLVASLIERVWVTRADHKVRRTHRPMHGQRRAWAETFTSGAGVPLRFPRDPRAPMKETGGCRCHVAIRLLQPGNT